MKLDLSKFDGATPGEWRAETQKSGLCGYVFCGDYLESIHIANVHPQEDGQTMANARLMAASPTLLAACLEMKQALEDLLDDMGNDGLCVCPAAKEQAIQALSRFTSEVEK